MHNKTETYTFEQLHTLPLKDLRCDILRNTARKYGMKPGKLLKGEIYKLLCDNTPKQINIDRSKCVNSEDLYTCEPLQSIDSKFFFYINENEKFYGFDIRTFNNIIMSGKAVNPYTLYPISDKYMEQYRIIKSELGNLINYPKYEFKDDISRINDRALNIFHRFDLYGHYTSHMWFMNMGITELKKLYLCAADIWNICAGLDNEKKQNMRKNGIAYITPSSDIVLLKASSINNIRDILLDEFENFLNEGKTDADKKLSILLILKSIVIVSREAAEALPGLV